VNALDGIWMHRAFVRCDEEQGRGNLFSMLEEFNEIKDVIFDPDSENIKLQERGKQFVDRHFWADYVYSTCLDMVHEECKQRTMINYMFDEVDKRTLRD
jgi:hypothetical protein